MDEATIALNLQTAIFNNLAGVSSANRKFAYNFHFIFADNICRQIYLINFWSHLFKENNGIIMQTPVAKYN